ncbi:MAG: hypothetical protein IJF39_04805 [Clostridia bacterium]|nr:hypothetical protein [Clostridia bacterium]
MQKIAPENLILLCGELTTDGTPVCNGAGKEYFEFLMKITLPTGVDILPVLIAKEQMDDTVQKGATLSLTGKIFSEEVVDGEDRTLLLKVRAEEVYAGETEITSGVFLTGNVFRKPYSYAIGEGERAEFQLTVDSADNPLVYVPVMANEENAVIAKRLQLGDAVSILGQLHSYQYMDLGDDGATTKTAYEVEILRFTALPEI